MHNQGQCQRASVIWWLTGNVGHSRQAQLILMFGRKTSNWKLFGRGCTITPPPQTPSPSSSNSPVLNLAGHGSIQVKSTFYSDWCPGGNEVWMNYSTPNLALGTTIQCPNLTGQSVSLIFSHFHKDWVHSNLTLHHCLNSQSKQTPGLDDFLN